MNYYLTYFPLREVMAPHCRADIWKIAFEYLKETGDEAGWHVLVYGA